MFPKDTVNRSGLFVTDTVTITTGIGLILYSSDHYVCCYS